jgi:hypothetical protein
MQCFHWETVHIETQSLSIKYKSSKLPAWRIEIESAGHSNVIINHAKVFINSYVKLITFILLDSSRRMQVSDINRGIVRHQIMDAYGHVEHKRQ